MQKELTENLNKIMQCVSKPMMELTELNIKTFNHLSKNTVSFEDLTQVKKSPEDILSAQVRITNAACQVATKYTQEAMEIGVAAVSEANKLWVDSLSQLTSKTSDFVKTSTNAKNRD